MTQGGSNRTGIVFVGIFRHQTADEEGCHESDGHGQQDGQDGKARALAGEKPVVNQADAKQVNKAEKDSKHGFHGSVSFFKVFNLDGCFAGNSLDLSVSYGKKLLFSMTKREGNSSEVAVDGIKRSS